MYFNIIKKHVLFILFCLFSSSCFAINFDCVSCDRLKKHEFNHIKIDTIYYDSRLLLYSGIDRTDFTNSLLSFLNKVDSFMADEKSGNLYFSFNIFKSFNKGSGTVCNSDNNCSINTLSVTKDGLINQDKLNLFLKNEAASIKQVYVDNPYMNNKIYFNIKITKK